MTVDFREAKFDLLSDLFNQTVLSRYRIDSVLLQDHTTGSPTFDWGASCISPQKAFIAVKKSPAMIYKGPNSDTAHICCLGYKDPVEMVDLLGNLKTLLIHRGVSKIQFGSDSGHLFPGCPTDCGALSDFLSISGFQEGGLAHDLERDLLDYQIPCSIPPEVETRRLQESDEENLNRFLTREFPQRWHYDTFSKIESEKSWSFIVGLFINGICEGFALTHEEGCKSMIGGAVWHLDLGAHWCSLGPIGVSKGVRGRGYGNALLGGALEILRDSGGRRCIIDWTTLVEFYGAHGFEVTRNYRMQTLDLDSLRPQ